MSLVDYFAEWGSCSPTAKKNEHMGGILDSAVHSVVCQLFGSPDEEYYKVEAGEGPASWSPPPDLAARVGDRASADAAVAVDIKVLVSLVLGVGVALGVLVVRLCRATPAAAADETTPLVEKEEV